MFLLLSPHRYQKFLGVLKTNKIGIGILYIFKQLPLVLARKVYETSI